jgi:hypothetical protein
MFMRSGWLVTDCINSSEICCFRVMIALNICTGKFFTLIYAVFLPVISKPITGHKFAETQHYIMQYRIQKQPSYKYLDSMVRIVDSIVQLVHF